MVRIGVVVFLGGAEVGGCFEAGDTHKGVCKGVWPFSLQERLSLTDTHTHTTCVTCTRS